MDRRFYRRSDGDLTTDQESSLKNRRRESQSLDNSNRIATLHTPCTNRRNTVSPPVDISLSLAQMLSYPLVPCRSPILRSPTPPGLPSFGTREAEQLRLLPPSHLERISNFLRRGFTTQNVTDNTGPALADESARSASGGPTRFASARIQADSPTEILRRMLGTNRPKTVPVGSTEPRRMPLPRGVLRSSSPGVLVQAEDRTNVRGSFGNRASGHGVGSRHVDHHPLARLTNTSEIEAVVQAIDKACGRLGDLTAREGGPTRAPSENSTQSPSNSANVHTPQTRYRRPQNLNTTHERQGIEREQRIARSFGAEKCKTACVRATLKVLQSPAAFLDPQICDRQRRLTSEDSEINTHRHHRVGNKEIVGQLDIGLPLSLLQSNSQEHLDAAFGVAEHERPQMIEPALYSSYSSYSYTPENSLGSATASQSRVHGELPTMMSMLEQQERAEREEAPHRNEHRWQQTQETQATRFDICLKWTCGTCCCLWTLGSSLESRGDETITVIA